MVLRAVLHRKVSLGRRVERFIQSFYSISNIVSLPGERLAFVHDGGIPFSTRRVSVTKTYSEAVSSIESCIRQLVKATVAGFRASVKSFDDKLNLRRSVEIPTTAVSTQSCPRKPTITMSFLRHRQVCMPWTRTARNIGQD